MNVSKKRSRSRTPKPLAHRKQARSKLPAVQRASSTELHSIDVPLTSVDADSTGSFTLLNGTIPGDNLQNRDGRKIQMRSCLIRGMLRFDKAGAAPTNDLVRVILFYDRQTNSTAPVLSDVLRNIDSAGNATSTSLSAMQMASTSRILILRDHMWALPTPAGSSGALFSGQTINDVYAKGASFKWFVKLPNLETHYGTGVAGTVADIATGSLYLLVLGLNANANSEWGITFESRVRFADG